MFATFYASYNGITFLTMMAILMAPLLHRFLHGFHLAISEEEKTRSPHHHLGHYRGNSVK